MVYFVSGHELAVHQHGEELMDGAGQDAAVAHDPRTEGEEMAVLGEMPKSEVPL